MSYQTQHYPIPFAAFGPLIAPYAKTRQFRGGGRIYHTLPNIERILEPQAGQGAMVDMLIEHYGVRKKNIFCIEIDRELQYVLIGKGYKVIETDFFDYAGEYPVDLILMNPPFNEGVNHLLHAWRISRGGEIACLLNAETLLNPYSQERQLLLRLIGEYGRWENLGPVFKNAERPTDVDVAAVWLTKPEQRSNIVDFGNMTEYDHDDTDLNEAEFSANPLAHFDIFESLSAQYQAAVRVLVAKADLEKQYRYYIGSVAKTAFEEGQAPEKLTDEIERVKQMFWAYVFEKTRLGKVTTSSFQDKFIEFKDSTNTLAFTVANLRHMLDVFYQKKGDIMEECLLDIFDRATEYHDDNKVHTEGWKTNKSYRCNHKIIVPDGVDYEPSFGGSFSRNHYKRPFFDDLDKVMAYIDGRPPEGVLTVQDALEAHILAVKNREVDYKEKTQSDYFEIRMHKKGTVHLWFLREDILRDFNLRAAQGKGWIGPGY